MQAPDVDRAYAQEFESKGDETMFNEFETQLLKFKEEAAEIQQMEQQLQMRGKMFQDKWTGFLKSSGLPDQFTGPEMLLLAVKKSRG